MDPNQTLVDARAACRHWHEGERGDHDLIAFDELVSAFEALDQRLSRGGSLPRAWELRFNEAGNRLADITETKE